MGSNTDYIYLPKMSNSGGSTKELIALVNDLNKTKNFLNAKYENTLRSIQDKYYLNTVIDTQLQKELNKEINNYKQSELKLFKQNKINQDNSVMDLYNSLAEMKQYEQELYKQGLLYNKVKSFAGQNLTVSNVRDNKYLVHLNNQCINSSQNNPLGLDMCDTNALSQRFEVRPVYDNMSYYTEFQKNPTKEELELYPYNILKSSITGLCVEDVGGKITVNKCNSLKGQKWIGLIAPNTDKRCNKKM
jgi:hypothetical protein